MDADYFVVPGGVGAFPIAAVVGGGGEDEDVGVFSVVYCSLEVVVARDAAGETEGHGDDVDLPSFSCVGNCLSEALVYVGGQSVGQSGCEEYDLKVRVDMP